jgi:prepilin-type N-terminal cleavage/methylation domain-containing protein
MKNKASANCKAFTLLEVLVTCAVLGVLLAILLGILDASMKLWRDTDSKIFADREARAARLQISRDISNIIIPRNPTLWPRVVEQDGDSYLQFLTANDPLNQSEESDRASACFVEYAISGDQKTLTRLIWGSRQTFDEIIQTGNFPTPGSGSTEDIQLLAGNLLPENSDAVRGLGDLEQEAGERKFIILTGAGLLPDPVAPNNPPRAIEINFAAADPESVTDENLELLDSQPNMKLRNAGLFSFRINLPEPPTP